jgi:ATP-binding cassette, subfamily B, multidrug efflux pump
MHIDVGFIQRAGPVDSIFVLERGEVVEDGSHSELIGQGGYYADLYQKQLLEEELEAI